jgi:hypothetical protein
MRNRLLLLPGMLVVLIILSFTDRTTNERFIGRTYGICDCADSKSMKFNVTFKDDHTFHYFKNDDPANVIDVSGKWEVVKNNIVLSGYDAATAIHDKWTFDKNELCLKSKKGFEWTRLCQVKPCK